ncbi:MAG TPA: DNA cytosine methyltransferase [Vicinamibacterales bacterium]|nr:DNA cytosine methyltransferase [Vicinamibacterales bacterium]
MTRNPTIGSVFSGIGGFDLGFQRAGFDLTWMCEREPFCRRVLAERFAGVPCFDDVTTLAHPPHVDVLVGGFPCQDVSIAGQRKGLSGERSGLFYEFARLIAEVQPTWWVIENVPGLLTSADGRDFAAVLGALDELGYVGGWRVLDSQYFGVAQRRDRVFVIGGARGLQPRADAVLFDATSGAWDLAPRQQAGPRPAATLRGRSHGAGVHEPGRGGEDDQNLICFDNHDGQDSSIAPTIRSDSNGALPMIATTLKANSGRNHIEDQYVAGTLLSHSLGKGRGTQLEGHGAYIATLRAHKQSEDDFNVVASPVTASAGHHGHSSPRGDGRDNLIARPLKSGGNDRQDESHETYINSGGVRRLTPLECERLQGFPDGWTCLCGNGHRGSAFCKCPDTPRYKALGNAVTVNVAEWIARRMREATV